MRVLEDKELPAWNIKQLILNMFFGWVKSVGTLYCRDLSFYYFLYSFSLGELLSVTSILFVYSIFLNYIHLLIKKEEEKKSGPPNLIFLMFS